MRAAAENGGQVHEFRIRQTTARVFAERKIKGISIRSPGYLTGSKIGTIVRGLFVQGKLVVQPVDEG